ncbi:E3 ubiquitin-protein ligase RING1-like [Magnolia sinica]|uniref:E3 ubiquitin-protein ligase RING1-like n=1 Tax=Magnolia sinica TaxID=86752 RepID=UPI002659DC0B|nr:E3 ubiquitin-protein ligase RING1-like [Magnolia sinica]
MALRRGMLLASRLLLPKDDCDPDDCIFRQTPPFNPPPPPSSLHKSSNHHISLVLIVVSIFSTAFLFVTYYTIIKRYCRRRIVAAGPTQVQIDTTHHEDHDESQNPINYIWYVNTVGLDESVINSIAVCKYKRGDGLVEGTECSVCLSEFHEDENLRLLPKCNHAFHLPCIDTWLKSHVNCPLCRANVVSGQPSSAGPSLNPSDVAGETQVENSRRITDQTDGFVSASSFLRAEEAELESGDGRGDIESANGVPSHTNCRAQSDLADNHRLGDSGIEMPDDGIQPLRRSVSMDSSSAAMICMSFANLLPVDSNGSSSSMAIKPSGMKRIVPKHGRSQSFFKLMGNCSKAPFLQMGPVAMKRSFSAGGKFLLSRYGGSRKAALPL